MIYEACLRKKKRTFEEPINTEDLEDTLDVFITTTIGSPRKIGMATAACFVVPIWLFVDHLNERTLKRVEESPAVQEYTVTYSDLCGINYDRYDKDDITMDVTFYANKKDEYGNIMLDTNGQAKWFECHGKIERERVPSKAFPVIAPNGSSVLANCVSVKPDLVPSR